MLTCALQSGSNGNCIYVETADTRLLFDAGISGRQVLERLARRGRNLREVQALFLSHDHADHSRAAGTLHRRFQMPLFMTKGTYRAVKGRIGPVRDYHCLVAGQAVRFGGTTVEVVATPHDGAEGVAFVVREGRASLGVFTDLGHRFDGIEQWIAGLDALYLESNYDPDMLEAGPYPPWLRARIRGRGGHLSNHEAAELVRDCGHGLKLLVLAHLSEKNNAPERALMTARQVLGEALPICCASRSDVSEMFAVG